MEPRQVRDLEVRKNIESKTWLIELFYKTIAIT